MPASAHPCCRFFQREKSSTASLEDIRPRDIIWIYEVEPRLEVHLPPTHADPHEPLPAAAPAPLPFDVPRCIEHLSVDLIKQAMEKYPCWICHDLSGTRELLLHKNCDRDALVCIHCIDIVALPRQNTPDGYLECARCPGCEQVASELQWPMLFEYITGVDADEHEPRNKPPVPPRPVRVLNMPFVHIKRELHYGTFEHFGLPFLLAMPSRGMTGRRLHAVVVEYLTARGLLVPVAPIENPFEQDVPLATFELHLLTEDYLKCYKCSRAAHGGYTSCPGCSPIPIDAEESLILESGSHKHIPLCLLNDHSRRVLQHPVVGHARPQHGGHGGACCSAG